MFYRKCRICGCSLDPGEGSMCEECRDEKEREWTRAKTAKSMIICTDYYQMSLEEFINA